MLSSPGEFVAIVEVIRPLLLCVTDVGQRAQLVVQDAWFCVNCGDSLRGQGKAAGGVAVAWYWHCRACSELAAGQMDLVVDQPAGVFLQIYRCRICGTHRSCRPGWQTRCHVCLDERSSGPMTTEAAGRFRAALANDTGLARQVRLLAMAPGWGTDRAQVEASAAVALAAVVRRAERPGWDVLAADVKGLPWTGGKAGGASHGTWARHQACGTIAKMRPGSVDCPACGPVAGSRTHLARRDDSYLLYLVVHRRWQKFGIGDSRRVKVHQRGGADVVQVLRAPFAQVVLAEAMLKREHRKQVAGHAKRGMISSFGQGTEVTRRKTPIRLTEVLPQGEDVTYWFR